MRPGKKKVIEIYDKNKGKCIKAVVSAAVDVDKTVHMYDLILAQIEQTNLANFAIFFSKIFFNPMKITRL